MCCEHHRLHGRWLHTERVNTEGPADVQAIDHFGEQKPSCSKIKLQEASSNSSTSLGCTRSLPQVNPSIPRESSALRRFRARSLTFHRGCLLSELPWNHHLTFPPAAALLRLVNLQKRLSQPWGARCPSEQAPCRWRKFRGPPVSASPQFHTQALPRGL